MIALGDLKDYTQNEIIDHLVTEYSGEQSGFDYGEINKSDIEIAKDKLKDMDILIAYQHVGSWGCDSSAFYLLQNRLTMQLFEIHASHCSCFGFEGQLDLEESKLKYLKDKASSGSVFWCGGYDDNEKINQKIVNDFILSL